MPWQSTLLVVAGLDLVLSVVDRYNTSIELSDVVNRRVLHISTHTDDCVA